MKNIIKIGNGLEIEAKRKSRKIIKILERNPNAKVYKYMGGVKIEIKATLASIINCGSNYIEVNGTTYILGH